MSKRFYCDFDGPIVETRAGKLRGYLWGDTYHFLGVLYGTAERFMSPEPVQPWDGVQDAFVTGDCCPLASRSKPRTDYVALLSQNIQHAQSEDCLNLNLWTPTIQRGAKKPVIVWIAGGGFHAGAVNETAGTDGASLSEFGDVVVVSLNHRIAILGFLDLSPFDPERYRNTGNKGLEDLVLALEWIRDNIDAFGGDPDNVTLMGHSGGGCKLWALMQTPAADGLYHKCVMESGCSANMVFPQREHNGYHIVHKTLETLGLTDADVSQLETMDYNRLLDAYLAAYAEESAAYMRDGVYRYVGKTILPNEYFAGYPFDVGLRKESWHIPCIISSALGESGWHPELPGNRQQWPEEARMERLRQIYGDRTEEIVTAWRAAYPDKDPLDLIEYETCFRTQIIRWCEMKEQMGAPCWLYLFALNSPMDGGLPAHHGSDVAFALHNVDKLPAAQIPGVSERVEAELSRALVQFARVGNPNHEGLPYWPQYSKQTRATMIFDRETRLGIDHDRTLLRIQNECVPWRRFPI